MELALEQGKVNVRGWIQVRKKEKDKKTFKKLWEREVPNKIVNVCLADIANYLIGASVNGYKYGAIGTDSTAAANADAALGSQILTRKLATGTRITTSVTNDTGQFVSNFTADATYAVVEYATFETASAGLMLNRVTFGSISLTSGDALEFTYKAQVSRV